MEHDDPSFRDQASTAHLKVIPARRNAVRRVSAIVVLLVGVGINLWEIAGLGPSRRPFRTHPDDSLTHLVYTEQRSLGQQFGIYFDMAALSEAGTLIADPSFDLDGQFVSAFGWEFVERDYQPDVPPSLATAAFFQSGDFQSPDGVLEVWVPAEGPSARSTAGIYWLGVTGNRLFVVPESLAPVPAGG